LESNSVRHERSSDGNAMQSAMEIIETFVEPLWDVIDGDAEPESAAAAVRARLPAD
jgi:hypothetical protein